MCAPYGLCLLSSTQLLGLAELASRTCNAEAIGAVPCMIADPAN